MVRNVDSTIIAHVPEKVSSTAAAGSGSGTSHLVSAGIPPLSITENLFLGSAMAAPTTFSVSGCVHS